MRRAGAGRAVLCCSIVGMVLVAGCTGSDDSPTSVSTTLPAPVTSVDTGASSPVTVVIDGGATQTTDPVVEVVVTADAAATEVQVATEPSFTEAEWVPIGSPVELELDGGYQVVYARARAGADSTPTRTGVTGITVDQWFDAATASAEGGPHRPSWAALIAPDVLQVRVETGRVVLDGSAPDDLVLGRPLDTDPVDDPATYLVDGGQIAVVGVSRVTRPIGTIISGTADAPVVHDLAVRLAAPLPVGVPHTLEFAGADIEPITFTIDPSSTRSPAVHVNQIGFMPDDRPKSGYVSSWTGAAGGVDYDDVLDVEVIDVRSGASVWSGTTTKRSSADLVGEFGVTNTVTGAEVLEVDFSELDRPGEYRLCVTAIGCSFDFAIGDTSWQRVAVAVARSAYHQRNGIALGQPFTPIQRPRPFHPDDGKLAREVPLSMTDRADTVGRDDRFEEYAQFEGTPLTDQAWGGHFDAGDFNSRVDHLAYLRTALDLVELYPDRWASIDLNIPESGDGVPDLVDEGLWDLDLYLRLQHDDGGVPGAVDQSRFAEGDETSWDNDISVVVYEPDAWSTYVFVAAAARAAVVLEPYDAERAATYRDAATRAMTWAEALSIDSLDSEVQVQVTQRRAVAAAAMLQLTEDPAWNDVFLEATDLDERTLEPMDCDGPVCDAAWLYARLDADLVDPTTQQHAIESFVATADAVLTAQSGTAFGWSMERVDMPMVWGLGPAISHGVGPLRAFVLTGDERYRDAMVRAASFSLGGNPLDTVFATGLGTQPARFPLVVDARASGLEVSPGLFQYGPHDLSYDGGDDWVEQYFLGPAGTTPAANQVPLLWSWYDVGLFPQMNEFTFHQAHAASLWTMGVLAAT